MNDNNRIIFEALKQIDAYTFWVWVIAIVAVISGLLILLSKIYKSLNKYFAEKYSKSSKDKTIENHIIESEKRFAAMEERLDKIVNHSIASDEKLQNSIDELLSEFNSHMKTDAKRTIANSRYTLSELHKEFMKQEYVTESGLKTFTEIGKVYEEAGGNDIYHNKLRPEVMSLPVQDVTTKIL